MLNDADKLALLSKVNRAVNGTISYRTDMALYGKSDFWDVVEKAGDCDDYALTKRARLIAAGFDARALRLAICRDETGAGHAVLTCDIGGTTWCLDNRWRCLMTFNQLRERGYRFLQRQSAMANVWESVANG